MSGPTEASANKHKLDNENSQQTHGKTKFARFEANQVNVHDWELPSDMAEYLHNNLKKYIPDQTLQQAVLAQNVI